MIQKLRIPIAVVAVAAVYAAGVVRAESNSAGELLALYGKVHAALAVDSATGVAEAAAQIAAMAEHASHHGPATAAYAAVFSAAKAMTGDDLAVLRDRNKALSLAFAGLVESGVLSGAQLYYCPMADGYWLQAAADSGVKNPYYGKSMLKCGSKVDKVED